MIITVLIIPLSLAGIFIILFYSVTHLHWLMTYLHLVGVTQWHGMTGKVCITLLLTIAVISLIATLITALFITFLNQATRPLKR